MRPTGTSEELERRRLNAVKMFQAGKGATEVGRRLGIHLRTAQRWQERYRRDGPTGLKAHPHPGRRPRLTMGQKRRLVRELLRGPKVHGFSTDLWTGRRVETLIRKRFGVTYHPHHIPRLLHAMGWSPQRPEGRAYERDEPAIARWLSKDWPRIKKSPAT